MILEQYQAVQVKNFHIRDLNIKSQALKANPLGDSPIRSMPLLEPKSTKARAIVWVLAGFSGNGPNYLNIRPFESNFAENLDQWLEAGDAPSAIYVFVDAWTFFGGSQFINSSAVGNYEDYITKDLYPLVNKEFPGLKNVVMGGSSGGYGALHLASKFPDKFNIVGAIAPDSFFEALFLPEFYSTKNFFINPKNNVKKLIQNGELQNLRNWHSILNVYAMSACYSPKGKKIEIPFDFKFGKLKPELWKKWLAKDPVHFLAKRKDKLKKVKAWYLEVGNKDQFNLQFGARQIHDIFKKNKIAHHYEEFDGTHFDLSTRRKPFFQWLNKKL